MKKDSSCPKGEPNEGEPRRKIPPDPAEESSQGLPVTKLKLWGFCRG